MIFSTGIYICSAGNCTYVISVTELNVLSVIV
jgi:hypothetical protein